MTIQEPQKFLPEGALARRVEEVRAMPGLATLTAAIEDQSQTTFGDILWAVRQWIINLGALSVASHLRHLGLGKVHAYYPIMGMPAVTESHDLIGLSCSEVSVAACLVRIKQLRNMFGEQPLLVVGGPGMDGWWEMLLDAGADVVVLGDGQFPLTDLLGQLVPLKNGGTRTLREAFQDARTSGVLEQVRDVAFLDRQGKKQRTPAQGLVRNLDEYVPADYALIKGFKKVWMPWTIKCAHHSSGCVFRCDFCSSIVNQRHCYRQVTLDRLVEDLAQAQKEGFHELFLASDLLLPGSTNANRKMLEELARKRAERGITIKLSSQTTVASLHNLVFRNAGTEAAPQWEEDPAGIKLLQDIGAYRWSLGVEAFSDEERSRLGKDPRQAGSDGERTLTTLCRHGMHVHAMMMVHEDTTYERAVQIGRILARAGVATVQFFYPIPAPQTPWGAAMLDRQQFMLGTVASEVGGSSRCTGEYVVAAKSPRRAVLAVETCYDSFTSTANTVRDVLAGRWANAAFKVGIRALILARRYLVPQYSDYLRATLSGDYSYRKPGDAILPGDPLSTRGAWRLDFRVAGLLRHGRREFRTALPPAVAQSPSA